MANIFNAYGIDIAGILAKSFRKAMLPVTLIKRIPRARGADATAGNNPSSTPYFLSGMKAQTTLVNPATLVRTKHPVISFLGADLPAGVEPEALDELAFEGRTYVINTATWDPANAWFVCTCS